MGLRINQNIAAQNAYRSLTVSDNQMSKSLEKLSSGSRINRASDDAAGLAISEGLRSQVGGLKVASRNAQDGVSVVQTAEGALNETHAILQRMRDLAVQSSNDSNNAAARSNITTEVTSLTDELTRIGNTTNFNGAKLLNGNAGGAGNPIMKFQVGADGDLNSQIKVDLSTADVTKVATAVGGSRASFDVDTPTLVTGNLSFTNNIDKTVDTVNGSDVTFVAGAAGTYKTVSALADALNADVSNTPTAASTKFGDRFSASVDANNKLVVTSKFGAGVTGTASATATGVTGGTFLAPVAAGGATGAGTGVTNSVATAGVDFSSAAGSQAAITTIDKQITAVSNARAQLGAYQNRFEHAINNVNVAVENLSASESRIRDTDMAQEMMSYTRSQILSQAGTAMLAQANQSQQGVLSLLRG
ncbi:MAG: flagellin [Actinoplanes sp.]|jgi:flagellin|nr:flagellin [Actinoplanes sp.]